MENYGSERADLGRLARGVALAVGMLAAVQATAQAELTVADLTENAVVGVGPYHQQVADAIKDFSKGDYRGALSRLEAAKKTTPLLPPPEVMMARLYFDANLTAAGFASLEQVVRRLPQDPEALVMLAERAMADGRMTEAGLLFDKAAPLVESFRENSRRRENLKSRLFAGSSVVDEMNESYAAAQKKLEELLALDPKNPALHQRLARVLFRLGNGEKAYEEFKVAAAADPNLPPAELAMAGMFSDKANADKWTNFALKNHGQDVRTQLAAGYLRYRENRIDEAKKHSDAALKLDPDGLQSNVLAGLVARARGEYDAAVKYLNKAHLLAPADPTVINNLALSLIELPDEASHQRALQFAELNAKQYPNNIEAIATVGWIYYRNGRRAEGVRRLAAAHTASVSARDNQVTTDLSYYTAVLYNDSGESERAIQMLKDALNVNQPFAYRKPALELLAELEKQDSSKDPKAKATSAPRGAKAVGAGP